MLADAGVPVVVHAGSGPAPGAFTGPGPIGEVLDRHPTLPLIAAHMGMPEYDEFLGFAERYDNVRVDTTMCFTDFSEPDGLGERLAPRLDGLARQGAARRRLSEHPLPVRPPARGAGPARARR